MEEQNEIEYKLENKQLGKGAFGVVYLGTKIEKGKSPLKIALKEIPKNLDKEALQNLSNEVSISSRLDNTNIVRMIEIVELNGKKYLAYELCNGGDLRRYMRYFGKFDEELIQIIVIKMINGLDELHKKKVIHHDIKPENILIQLYEDKDKVITPEIEKDIENIKEITHRKKHKPKPINIQNNNNQIINQNNCVVPNFNNNILVPNNNNGMMYNNTDPNINQNNFAKNQMMMNMFNNNFNNTPNNPSMPNNNIPYINNMNYNNLQLLNRNNMTPMNPMNFENFNLPMSNQFLNNNINMNYNNNMMNYNYNRNNNMNLNMNFYNNNSAPINNYINNNINNNINNSFFPNNNYQMNNNNNNFNNNNQNINLNPNNMNMIPNQNNIISQEKKEEEEKKHILEVLKKAQFKLSDFGLSKIKDDIIERNLCGSPLYMAPELFNPDTSLKSIENYKVDIWALGVLTFEMYFGRRPFEAFSIEDLAKMYRKGEYYINFGEEGISKELFDFINMCLQKDPKKRANISILQKSDFYNFDKSVLLKSKLNKQELMEKLGDSCKLDYKNDIVLDINKKYYNEEILMDNN